MSRELQQACGPSDDEYCDCYCSTFLKQNRVCLWVCKVQRSTDDGYKHTFEFWGSHGSEYEGYSLPRCAPV